MARYYRLPCYCDKGIMLHLQASKRANNPGRWFYKCPMDDAHKFNFIWPNELMDPKYKHLHCLVKEQDQSFTSSSSATGVNDSTTVPHIRSSFTMTKDSELDQCETDVFTSGMHEKVAVDNSVHCQPSNSHKKEGTTNGNGLGAISLICCCVGSVCATVGFGMALVGIAIAMYK